MPFATPKFQGVWVQLSQLETVQEQSHVKLNKKTRAYLIRIIKNLRTSYKYAVKTDSDTIGINGDSLAIENLNDPVGAKPWEYRLESLTVNYNPETGVATATKTLVKDEQKWTRKKDLPINLSRTRVV